ncbi:MAG: HD domain-containing protein [Clostridia bacterium]|nr:HD domain-containing protein [Clostridia bacterium]
MENSYKNAIEKFNKYIKQFDMTNEMISRKYYHTFRVANYAKELAKSENLNEQDTFIAYLCGILHDIARFKQATEYKTFSDFKSFDHGDMGYNILVENDYISNYIQDEESKQIILKAVKNHNKYEVETGLTDRQLFFTKLIRDSDKIDILDKLRNEIHDNSTTIDEDVMQAFKEHRLYKRDGTIRNDATQILISLCFVFDLNFKRSLEIIKEKGIVERKLKILKEHLGKEFNNIDEPIK